MEKSRNVEGKAPGPRWQLSCRLSEGSGLGGGSCSVVAAQQEGARKGCPGKKNTPCGYPHGTKSVL